MARAGDLRAASGPATIGSVSTSTCWPSTASCSIAAGRRVSSEAISTLRLSRSVSRLASLAVVVVLPEPCRPTIMIGTGAGGVEIDRPGVGAERADQLVVHDLHDHLAGRHRLDDVDADRALLHLLDEGARHVERDVGLEQRAAHLAQRRVDVGLRQRAAPRQAVEHAAKAIRQVVEQRATPQSWPRAAGQQTRRRPRAHRAVGRWPPASGTGRRVENFTSLSRTGRNWAG